MTNKNKPRVSMVAGSVNKTSKGFTMASRNDKTMATTTAVPKLVIEIPGKIASRINTFTEQTNILSNHFCIF